jgi:hypothetical protein
LGIIQKIVNTNLHSERHHLYLFAVEIAVASNQTSNGNRNGCMLAKVEFEISAAFPFDCCFVNVKIAHNFHFSLGNVKGTAKTSSGVQLW